MMSVILLLLSIGLQLAAAVSALLLIRITGKKLAWIFISLAITLMSFRRSVLFVSFLIEGRTITFDSFEVISMITSVLMFAGCLRIGIYFRSIQTAGKECKKAEEQVRQEKREWENTFDSISSPIFIHDREFRVVKANRAYREASGMSFEGMAGRPYYEVFPKMKGPFNGCMQSLQSHEEQEEVSLPSIDKAYKVKFYPVFDVNGSYFCSLHILEDITGYKKLEEQLRHSQKMEAIGTLAGGIAHDFNNILTAIIGYASIMQMKMKEDAPLRAYLEQILASSERAAVLTQSLLAFSRKQISRPEPVNLNEIVRKAKKFLSRVIGEDIELKMILSDNGLTVMTDVGQIEQVLMNLATNARDAMPKGGALTIHTEPVELDSKFVEAFGYGYVGKYACITISDTGIGMDGATKEKIFEPFFTTKEVGKGTGLGLAVVYGIIKQHKGYINCYSELGKGTTFKIYLPLFESMPVSKTGTEGAAVAVPTGGTETILVAEDEESIRRLMKEVLEEGGYKVIEAAEGEEAVNKFMENKDRIDLLLLDIIMHKMGGREVYERIKKIKPDIKLLIASGYPADFISKKGMLEEDFNFVAKPMSPANLLKKVREALDK